MNSKRIPFPFLFLALATFLACSDSPTTEAGTEFLSLSVFSGDSQVGPIGEELDAPVTIFAEKRRGKRMVPAKGVVVNFVVTEGGGSVYAGTGITDKHGLATDWWTLGPVTGFEAQELEVRAVNWDGEKLVYGTFKATGIGPADSEGPLASNVSATPDPVAPGADVTVAAGIDDTSTGGSNGWCGSGKDADRKNG